MIRRCCIASSLHRPVRSQIAIVTRDVTRGQLALTNDPDAVRAFQREHGAVIYKSISGVRSIVHQLDDADMERLEHIRWCPVQFQALVPGVDTRVHVIGDEVHATEIVSDRLDYRYARRNGGSATLRAVDLAPEIAARCVALTNGLDLAFAGIDLKFTPDGEVFCFEVNPCPAFSFYQANTGQPIATSLARYLSGQPRNASAHAVQEA